MAAIRAREQSLADSDFQNEPEQSRRQAALPASSSKGSFKNCSYSLRCLGLARARKCLKVSPSSLQLWIEENQVYQHGPFGPVRRWPWACRAWNTLANPGRAYDSDTLCVFKKNPHRHHRPSLMMEQGREKLHHEEGLWKPRVCDRGSRPFIMRTRLSTSGESRVELNLAADSFTRSSILHYKQKLSLLRRKFKGANGYSRKASKMSLWRISIRPVGGWKGPGRKSSSLLVIK